MIMRKIDLDLLRSWLEWDFGGPAVLGIAGEIHHHWPVCHILLFTESLAPGHARSIECKRTVRRLKQHLLGGVELPEISREKVR